MSAENNSMIVFDALKPMIDKEIRAKTRGNMQMKIMVVSTAYNTLTKKIGVKEAFGEEVFLPTVSNAKTEEMTVGKSVWVLLPYGSMSNAIVWMLGDGSGVGGSGTNDYDLLDNRPSINGETLTGDVSLAASVNNYVPDENGNVEIPIADNANDGLMSKEQAISLSEKSNRNLLDNPFFTVNQREQMSYTAAGYTVDRWKKSGSANRVDVNSDSVTLTAAGTNFRIEQVIENYAMLADEKVTFSVDIAEVVGSESSLRIYADDTLVAQSDSPLAAGINAVTATMPDTISSNAYVRIYVSTNTSSGSLNVKSAKLELGETSTLANDTAPDYATELLKCQRYYYMNSYGVALQAGSVFNASSIRVGFVLPTPMRVTPTVDTSNVDYSRIDIYSRNGGKHPTSLEVSAYVAGQPMITLALNATGMTTGDCITIRFNTIFSLSADL